MQVILKEDVKGSGKKGDLVKVSDGYGRNYLIPKGLAMAADAQSIGEFKSKQDAARHRTEKELADAKELASRLNEKTVRLTANAGAGGKLFGSVTSKEIADVINKDFDCNIDKRKIALENDIKSFGTFTAQVKLHAGVTASVYVMVTQEQ